MVAIGSRTSRFSRGRPSPRPERQRQNSRQPRRCQPSTGCGRTEAGGVSSRGEAPHEEPEELGSSSQAWTTLGTPGNLDLRAEEQVLHHEVLTATDGGDEGGQDEPEEFEHRGRTPIQCHSEIARGLFAPYRPCSTKYFLRGSLTRAPSLLERHRPQSARSSETPYREPRSQTETWLRLSLVKAPRFQSPQRSRSFSPASLAMRSSSDGHT